MLRDHHPGVVPKGTPSLRSPSSGLPPALPRSAFCLPSTAWALRFLCGPSPAAFGAARSPPRRLARPSAPPGVWRSPSAPLAQITGKVRAAPCRGPTWGWGSPCPFYPPCVTPGTFSITRVSGPGPCCRATSTEHERSSAPALASSQPQSPRAHPTAPQAWDRLGRGGGGDVPSCTGTPKAPVWPHAGTGTAGPWFGCACTVAPGAGDGFCFAFYCPISCRLPSQ